MKLTKFIVMVRVLDNRLFCCNAGGPYLIAMQQHEQQLTPVFGGEGAVLYSFRHASFLASELRSSGWNVRICPWLFYYIATSVKAMIAKARERAAADLWHK